MLIAPKISHADIVYHIKDCTKCESLVPTLKYDYDNHLYLAIMKEHFGQ